MSDAYTTARHASTEMGEIAALHNRVFDSWGALAREQLRWKYVENPFVEDVTVMTATHAGDVVGMLGMVPQRVSVNRKSVLAFQTADAAVHPDHRRNGLLSRLFESFLSYARETEARLCTGFTNEAATQVFLEQGFTRMERGRYVRLCPDVSAPTLRDPTTYPGALLGLAHAGTVGAISAATGAIARLRARGWTVERFDDVPVSLLTDLYARAVPAHAHLARSERFYSWRLDEPASSFRAYVLFDESSEPNCGIITSQEAGTVLLRDVVPLDGGDPTALALLVASILADRAGADRFVALDGFPRARALLGNGFLPPSLNPVTPTSRIFITRPLADGELSVNGCDITASENWAPLHIERDF
jgi:GNAT superfamily N-acetyltransferase